MEKRYINSQGVNLYTEFCEGKTPWLVFIHGMSINSTVFKSTIQLLRERSDNAMLAYDKRGCGRSDKLMHPKYYGRDADVGDLDKILDNYRVDRAILIGHSQGTQTALQYADANPRKVGGLVMIAGSHDFAGTHPLQLGKVQRRAFDIIGKYGFIGLSILTLKPFKILLGIKQDYFDCSNMVPSPLNFLVPERKRLMHTFGWNVYGILDMKTIRAGVYNVYEFLRNNDLREEAKKLICPVLVMAGDKDDFIGGNVDKVGDAFENTERKKVVKLHNRDHLFLLDEPETVANEIRTFFNL